MTGHIPTLYRAARHAVRGLEFAQTERQRNEARREIGKLHDTLRGKQSPIEGRGCPRP